jgi:hypothetical protein
VATICVLRAAGITAELVTGVQRLPFRAHAWVEVDGVLINDHPARRRTYTVIDRC